jgi:hypothetical protein
VENLMFRINTGADDHIGSFDSSKNIAVSCPSRGWAGLEPSQETPKISDEIFAQTLAAAVSDFSGKRGLEKNLFCRCLFQGIIYSKESILINLFSPAAESAAANEFTPQNKKSPNFVGGFSKDKIKNGCLAWT